MQPETGGVVMPALLNALAGTGGTVLADLELLHGQTIDRTRTLLQSRLPPDLHLAVVGGHGASVGELGQLVTGHKVPLDAGWNVLAPALRAALPGGATPTLMLPAVTQAAAETPASASHAPPPLAPAPPAAPILVRSAPLAGGVAVPTGSASGEARRDAADAESCRHFPRAPSRRPRKATPRRRRRATKKVPVAATSRSRTIILIVPNPGQRREAVAWRDCRVRWRRKAPMLDRSTGCWTIARRPRSAPTSRVWATPRPASSRNRKSSKLLNPSGTTP